MSVSTHPSAFVGRGAYSNNGSAVSDFNLSVPFTYLHTIALGSPADSAYAQSTLFLSLLVEDPTKNEWSKVAGEMIDFYDTGSSGTWSSGGTLTLSSSQMLAAGDYALDIPAFAAAAASTPAVVPEPTIVALLGLGLAALGFSLRKR